MTIAGIRKKVGSKFINIGTVIKCKTNAGMSIIKTLMIHKIKIKIKPHLAIPTARFFLNPKTNAQ